MQIIVFPEMSITGYTCGDLFGQQILLEEAEMGLMQILNNTRQLDIISIVGMPVVVNSTVINAAVIQKGKVLGVAAKTYLPNYKGVLRTALVYFCPSTDRRYRTPMRTNRSHRCQHAVLKLKYSLSR